ncbi:MAG TPA: hypothetical protein DEO94_05555 [Cyanobacteria bacterium UBA11991]|nr:hypothetical protein [Cyanobacteriota bacterium]HCB11584.1 hypothetical protein [Cyanobacteria bacterium UBA11991]
MISKLTASTIYSTLGNNSSLIPLGIKDAANSCGLTAASYIAGDKLEGKDRFIDEFGTQAIWLFGIPTYKKILDNTIFKTAKLDPEIDPGIFKDKKIAILAKELAPSGKIQQNIMKAAKKQKLFKALTIAKFVASTALTALSYFGLTKFRHQYTENKIKKEYLAKKNAQEYSSEHIPFSAAFSKFGPKKKQSKVAFTGGIQDFMFDPVKNLMLVDGVITGERLTHARNPQDFVGYTIKEGSFWLFMYLAGPMISKALEKHAEKKYSKSIDLDARVIENEDFKNAFKSGKIKDALNEFKTADKSDADIYKFAVTNKDNLIIEMAKKSDIISIDKSSKKVDTRKFIPLGDNKSDNFNGLRGIYKKVEKLLNQYENSGQDIDTFFKAVRKLKRSSVIKNIGSCIGALGVLTPAIMLAVRFLSKDSGYQVKKDVEAKLAAQA